MAIPLIRVCCLPQDLLSLLTAACKRQWWVSGVEPILATRVPMLRLAVTPPSRPELLPMQVALDQCHHGHHLLLLQQQQQQHLHYRCLHRHHIPLLPLPRWT